MGDGVNSIIEQTDAPLDVSKLDLSQADLSGAGLAMALLTETVLRDTKIVGTDLYRAHLEGALRGADHGRGRAQPIDRIERIALANATVVGCT
ncbi:pentapeptide repeat-containing protein [Streptomyces vastus]|uniref:Pentapeptide repeat-containing protein n=1 Tax=Streptomyces vastus TaxID=285451 RepID=A0ABN3RPL0_9ACTN